MSQSEDSTHLSHCCLSGFGTGLKRAHKAQKSSPPERSASNAKLVLDNKTLPLAFLKVFQSMFTQEAVLADLYCEDVACGTLAGLRASSCSAEPSTSRMAPLLNPPASPAVFRKFLKQ